LFFLHFGKAFGLVQVVVVFWIDDAVAICPVLTAVFRSNSPAFGVEFDWRQDGPSSSYGSFVLIRVFKSNDFVGAVRRADDLVYLDVQGFKLFNFFFMAFFDFSNATIFSFDYTVQRKGVVKLLNSPVSCNRTDRVCVCGYYFAGFGFVLTLSKFVAQRLIISLVRSNVLGHKVFDRFPVLVVLIEHAKNFVGIF